MNIKYPLVMNIWLNDIWSWYLWQIHNLWNSIYLTHSPEKAMKCFSSSFVCLQISSLASGHLYYFRRLFILYLHLSIWIYIYQLKNNIVFAGDIVPNIVHLLQEWLCLVISGPSEVCISLHGLWRSVWWTFY